VVVPDAPLLRVLSSVQDDIMSRIVANRVQNRTLRALRDKLLPRLLSGEAHIRQAERLVEAKRERVAADA